MACIVPSLPQPLKRSVDAFLNDQDLQSWYKTWSREEHTRDNGVPAVASLEQELTEAARQNRLSRGHLIQVARWGGHPAPATIQCTGHLDLGLYAGTGAASWVRDDPAEGLRRINRQVSLMGPASMTRILRFAYPAGFGALGTGITRVFGTGDPEHRYLQLIDLEAEKREGRWCIRTPQPAWPEEYAKFIFLLRYMRAALNRECIWCPHPPSLHEAGLRSPGIWECADVETALSSFAAERLFPGRNRKSGKVPAFRVYRPTNEVDPERFRLGLEKRDRDDNAVAGGD